MEEDKVRRTATKARIDEFREEYKDMTDERLISFVEALYPKVFQDSLLVATEIVKELYRESEPLSEETFKAALSSMTEEHKLQRYKSDVIEGSKKTASLSKLVKAIYDKAQEGDIRLSQFPEYNTETKDYLEEIARGKNITPLKELSSLLNVEAMYRTSQDAIVRRNYLNFQVVQEQSGDILFTKGGSQPSGKKGGSGCLGVVALFLLLGIASSLLISNIVI